MERNITITLEKAKELYNSDNKLLKEIALQAFSKEEMYAFDFTEIKTFDNALAALGYTHEQSIIINNMIVNIKNYSKASAAMFMLNIVRKVLNTDYNMHLVQNADGQKTTWYPYFRFITKESTTFKYELKSGEYKKLGKIKSEGIIYDVLGGDTMKGNEGLGHFDSFTGIGYAYIDIGFLSCATKNIAKHFGEYFGMLVMEAMYGDMVDFEIIENKYQ